MTSLKKAETLIERAVKEAEAQADRAERAAREAEPLPMPPHSSKTCPDCMAHRAKKVRVELGQEELHFDGEGLMDQAAKLDVQDLLADLRKKYGEGGYRTKPLSDVELLTLLVAEQRAEIARLREDFEAHREHSQKRRVKVWDVLEIVAIVTLTAIVFVFIFGK